MIVINACTSFQRRRSSIPFRRCVPRTHSLEAEAQAREPEVVAASSASARALRAPTESRGCARGARVGCLRSAQLDGGHLPVLWVSDCGHLFRTKIRQWNLRSVGIRSRRRTLPSLHTRNPSLRQLP